MSIEPFFTTRIHFLIMFLAVILRSVELLAQTPRIIGAIPYNISTPVYEKPNTQSNILCSNPDLSERNTILPLLESYGIKYELPGCAVYSSNSNWYEIGLSNNTRGWIQKTGNEFYSIKYILSHNLPYLPGNWDGKIFNKPTNQSKIVMSHKKIITWYSNLGHTPNDNLPIKILEYKTIAAVEWVKITILESECDCVGPSPKILLTGWITLYDSTGKLRINYWHSC